MLIAISMTFLHLELGQEAKTCSPKVFNMKTAQQENGSEKATVCPK
jgi:hypothetical protein